MSYIALGRWTQTVILTVTGLLTAAALAVTGAFQLASQTAGQILWTNSNGVVTSTSDFRYASSTKEMSVDNAIFSKVTSTDFCLTGDDCITSWPTGTGGGETPQLTQAINAGSSATSTPSFDMGFTATTGVVTGLTWTNATGTNTTSTNLYAWNLNSATATIGTLFTYNGYVGINSSTPSSPLSISYPSANSSITQPILQMINPGGSQSGFSFSFSNGLQSQIRADSGGNFVFASKGTQYLGYPSDFGITPIINLQGTSAWLANGNLGIGTTTPNNFKLQVAGNIGPNANNLYDIGSAETSVRNVYASGTGSFLQGLSWTSATGTNTTSTNLYADRLFWANATGTNLTATTGIFTTLCLTGDDCITTWPSGSGGETPTFSQVLEAGNHATTTIHADMGIVATTGTFTNATATNLDVSTRFGWSNATGTSLFATSLGWTNAAFTNASGTTLSLTGAFNAGSSTVTTLNFSNATGSSLYAATLSAKTLVVRNIVDPSGTSYATLDLSGRSGEIGPTHPIPTSTQITVNGFSRTLPLMNATNTNCVFWGPEYIRDAWNAGVMKPEISWIMPTGTGAVVWSLRAQSIASGTYLGTSFTGGYSYATTSYSAGFAEGNGVMTDLTVGAATTGTPMKFELCRQAGANGDTFGNGVYLNAVKLEYGLASYSD